MENMTKFRYNLVTYCHYTIKPTNIHIVKYLISKFFSMFNLFVCLTSTKFCNWAICITKIWLMSRFFVCEVEVLLNLLKYSHSQKFVCIYINIFCTCTLGATLERCQHILQLACCCVDEQNRNNQRGPMEHRCGKKRRREEFYVLQLG